MARSGTLLALPESHPLFAREDWPRVRKHVKAVAYRLRPTLPEAQDLAHAAILRCLAHRNEPWRLPRGALIKWLTKCVAFISFDQRRHDTRFRHDPIAQEGADELDDGTSYTVGHILRSAGPSPEAAVARMEVEAIYRRRLVALARKVEEDALVALLVAEVMRNAESPMAAALDEGFNAEDIYNARKRLERAANAVLDDERRAAEASKEAPS
jgi:DNA-directed RNA polymerase specialized sigma24 family protein